MKPNKNGPPRVPAGATLNAADQSNRTASTSTGQRTIARATLAALLDGAAWVNVLRENGRPARVRWPDDPNERAALLDAHLDGRAMTLEFHADGHDPWTETVPAVTLAAFLPAKDGRCRWVAIDLDADDHGDGGLADPAHAARCIAERIDNAGLSDGLLVVRSRRGRGLHVFLIAPEPVSLDDAVLVVAGVAADAHRIAAQDVNDADAPHAFRRADGSLAQPGNAGAVELFPRKSDRPQFGWPLTLPCAAAFAEQGGGILVDPFDDGPLILERVPQCAHDAWERYVTETRAKLPPPRPSQHRTPRSYVRRAYDRPLSPRTADFLAGHTPQGERNNAAFAAACELFRRGNDLREVEIAILDGASRCGLLEREARAAIRSASLAVRR